MAIGTGAAGRAVDLYLVASVVGALALAAALWWAYFDRDDARAEHALTAATGDRRARMALMAFGYTYLVMLAGVIVLAAGLEGVRAHLGETTENSVAINQGVGVALYLIGETAFRRLLAIPPGRLRPLAALAAVATIPIGTTVSGLTQMWVLLAIVTGTLVVKGRRVEWQHTT